MSTTFDVYPKLSKIPSFRELLDLSGVRLGGYLIDHGINAHGHHWSFRRSAGQPAIINVAYGMIAGSLAELTEGFIYSGDSAWDHERFPATTQEFFSWYFRPDKAIKAEHAELAARCIKWIVEELKA